MMRSRHGKSLVEMLVVITAMSVLLGFVAQTFHTLRRAERASAQSLTQSVNLSRLARQFRHDVHAARQAERATADNQPEQLRLMRPDGTTILWSTTDDSVTRGEQRDGTRTAQERYRVGPARLRFDLSDDGTQAALIVGPPAVTPGIPAPPTGPKPLRIEAITGRDLRFATAAE